MNGNFQIGDHVKIKTAFCGAYHGRTGIVIEVPEKTIFQSGDPCVRVKFDVPIIVSEYRDIEDDIFKESELTFLEE
jgi:hypothetical protein